MRFARLLVLTFLVALVVVPAAFALRFTDASYNTPTGTVGMPYSHQFNADGGCGPDPASGNAGLPYQYRILSGGLPPGLSLSKSGLISGTPTTPGSYSFYVELSDEDPPSASWCTPKKAERAFTITIQPGLQIQQAQASVPTATVGVAYGPITFTAAGGGTQSWSATGLPPGLTLSPAGVLSGTPTTKGGDYRVSVRVQDTSGRSNTLTYALPVRDKLELTVPPAPRAEVGRPYSLGSTAAGGNEAYTREIAGLPAGLTFDPNAGVIAGSPTAAGTFAVKLTLKDTEGRVAAQDFLITVAPRLAFATTKLKNGKVGKAYVVTLKLKGGVGPIQWRLIRFRPGAKGVTFDKRTGTIRFTPSAPRRYTIVVRATDALKVISTKTLTLTVKA
jgi:large repetitive protein